MSPVALLDYKPGFYGTTRMDQPDVIYIDPDTEIGLAADLLMEYLLVMHRDGRSQFSGAMQPKENDLKFTNDLLDFLHGRGNLGAGHRPYRVDPSDIRLYNDLGMFTTSFLPVVGTTFTLLEVIRGESIEFVPEFVEELSPTQRIFTVATIAGPVLVGIAYKVGDKVLIRFISRTDDLADGIKQARIFRTFSMGKRLTGNAQLDRLVSGSPDLAAFLDKLKTAGYQIEQGGFVDDTIAQFSPGVFKFDPKQFRLFHLMHENRHFSQIQGAKNAGLDPFDFDRPMAALLEWDAYNFELSLARKYNLSADYVARTHQARDSFRWRVHDELMRDETFVRKLIQIFGYRPF